MFIRRGSRKAVWCIDTLVVWGYMFSFCFQTTSPALLETPLRSICVLFDDQQICLWSGHVCM